MGDRPERPRLVEKLCNNTLSSSSSEEMRKAVTRYEEKFCFDLCIFTWHTYNEIFFLDHDVINDGRYGGVLGLYTYNFDMDTGIGTITTRFFRLDDDKRWYDVFEEGRNPGYPDRWVKAKKIIDEGHPWIVESAISYVTCKFEGDRRGFIPYARACWWSHTR